MPCQETTNCDKFPNENCYQTEKECQCNCPGGTLDPDSDECKCLEEEKECINGRVRKTDCQCFCGVGKYLEDGVCYRYKYACGPDQRCIEVKDGPFSNWADCNSNCRGGNSPPCFPVPTAPVGTPLLCPDGRQYGLISYIYNPSKCRYEPFEIIWGNCNTLPPLPSSGPGPSSEPGGSSSSEEGCDCDAGFSGVTAESAEVCGETVPIVTVTPGCNGAFRVFQWCEECGCENEPKLKQQQMFVFRERSIYPPFEILCAFEAVPLSPTLGGPFPCPPACDSSSATSSTSAESGSSDSSSPCEFLGPTSINFSGGTATGTPLNQFGEEDYIEVQIYSPTGLINARESETKWKFYVVYPNPNTNPPETPTRYDITEGDFSADDWPTFILTSAMLLDAIDLNFDIAPNGKYPFQLCAEAINCTGQYDTQCAANGIVVNVTENNDPVSSSSSSTVAESSSSSSSSSSGCSPRPCFPGGPLTGRLLYFTGGGCRGGDATWDRLENWREISDPSQPSQDLCCECVPAYLPDATDTVILTHFVTTYTTTTPPVPEVRSLNGFSLDNYGLFIAVLANTSAQIGGLYYIGRDTAATPNRVGEIIAPSAAVTFTGGAVNRGKIRGSAIFEDNTINDLTGEITCGATFNDASRRLDTNKISGTVICNTTSLPCSTASNSTPSTDCPTVSGGALSAGLVAENSQPKHVIRFAAVAYTKPLRNFYAQTPDGWQEQNDRLIKVTEESKDIFNCQYKLWDLKNEIGLFYDGQYRLSIQSREGAWYAVPVYFGYRISSYRLDAGEYVQELTHIIDEHALQDN